MNCIVAKLQTNIIEQIQLERLLLRSFKVLNINMWMVLSIMHICNLIKFN